MKLVNIWTKIGTFSSGSIKNSINFFYLTIKDLEGSNIKMI